MKFWNYYTVELQLSLFPFNYWSYSRAGSRARKADRHARASARARMQAVRHIGGARANIFPLRPLQVLQICVPSLRPKFQPLFLSGLKIGHRHLQLRIKKIIDRYFRQNENKSFSIQSSKSVKVST